MTHRVTHGIGRRSLLAALARLPVVIAAAYAGISPRPVAAAEPPGEPHQPLNPNDLAVLERLAWLLFPVPGLAAGPYQRVAGGIAEAIQGEPQQLALVKGGIVQLDATAGGTFLGLAEPAQVEHLRHIESGDFFQFLYAATRNRLFDDREVWALLGYEGSSLKKGGYLNRGLSDIDWL